MERLKKLLERTTQGSWVVAYWPVPNPYHWIGVHDDEPLSSKLSPVTGAIAYRDDAHLIALAPTLAERYIEAVEVLRDLHAEAPSLRTAEVLAAADTLDARIKEVEGDEPA